MGGRFDLCNSWIGTTFAAKRWLSLDCCGVVCLSLGFFTHFYALSINFWLLIRHAMVFWQILYYAAYVPIALLAISSLFMAWTTNPGAVPMGAKPLVTFKRQGSQGSTDHSPRGIRRCHKCMDNFKPARAHHDSVTGRCIVKLDHYCPWVCNAVGALNHKFFVLFIGYTLVSTIMTLVFIVAKWSSCSYEPASADSQDSSPQGEEEADPSRHLQDTMDDCQLFQHYSPFVIVLLLLSVVFMVFTSCMLLEQVDAIASNTYKIARLKVQVGKAGSTELSRVTHDFNEMFGGTSPKPAWHWFVPIPVKYPKGMKKVVLGYEFDATLDNEHVPYDEEKDVADTSQHSAALSAGIVESPKSPEENKEFTEDQNNGKSDDMDNDDQSGPLVASPKEHAHLGSSKKKGVLKRRKDDSVFVDRTKSIS